MHKEHTDVVDFPRAEMQHPWRMMVLNLEETAALGLNAVIPNPKVPSSILVHKHSGGKQQSARLAGRTGLSSPRRILCLIFQ